MKNSPLSRQTGPAERNTIPFPGAIPASLPNKEGGRIVLQDPECGEARVLVACSDALLLALTKARHIARSKVPVLIEGETGTGKELVARLIHEHSPRREHALVQVNCAAFSENLVESELFGHEKGAFTGADQRHLGYFERAHEGSILLDEIGEMPLKLQAKLLRVLEEELFERVGGEKLIQVNVRLIATTNRDLEQEVELGHFRGDLFYRLNSMTVRLPPLRLRRQEIPPLVTYFIERYGSQGIVPVHEISPRALQLLLDYSWPGNIRQLRNVIHHACVVAQQDRIEPADLPNLAEPSPGHAAIATRQTLAELEKQAILETLRVVGGNQTAAALRLGVTTRTLQNKLKIYRKENAA